MSVKSFFFRFYSFLVIFLSSTFTSCAGIDPEIKVVLSGTLARSRTLYPDSTYLMVGTLVIPSGIRLTVFPGTTVQCDYKTSAQLIVLPGGELYVEGTESSPVTFTSNRSEGIRQKGDWGGILLYGNGINNQGEGITTGFAGAVHGGNEAIGIYSGSLIRYLKIQFAGSKSFEDVPLPGLGLYSLTQGTSLEKIQVHLCKGDGFVFSGGTVNAKYLVSTNNDGYGFVFSNGWFGKGQYWVGIQGDLSKSIYRAYNNLSDPNASTSIGNASYVTEPRIYNATLIGRHQPLEDQRDDAITISHKSKAFFSNHIIANFPRYAVSIYSDSNTEYEFGQILLQNSIAFIKSHTETNGALNYLGSISSETGVFSDLPTSWVNYNTDPLFRNLNFLDPLNGSEVDLRSINVGSSLANPNIQVTNPPHRFDDENTIFFNTNSNYIGAFSTENWLENWTSWITK